MKHTLLAAVINLDFRKEAVTQALPYSGPTGPSVLVSRVLAALMAVALISVLTFLIWGAFDWINSSGEKGKLESARNKMTGAVVGLFLLAATLAIFLFLQSAFGVNIINIVP